MTQKLLREFHPGNRNALQFASQSDRGAYTVIRDFIFLVLFFIFLAIWGVSWFALHVTGGLIHLLLLIAAISLVLHLFRGSRTV
jgi:small neutral amino acid transporter SnatA (MarC family)